MKNVRIQFVWVLTVLTMFTAGCLSVGRSPESRFYSLQTLKATEVPKANSDVLKGAIIGVGPIGIPGFLDRPQIVTRDSKDQLHFAEFDRWVEPLGESIKRVLAENFILQLPGVNALLYPWNPSLPVKYTVIMEIIRLEAQLDSEAVLVVNWSVLEAQKKEVLLTRQSTYRTHVAKAGYSSVVGAVSKLVAMLSIEIAQSMESLASTSAGQQ
jgi:uncharacterized lipoprotein YmbA